MKKKVGTVIDEELLRRAKVVAAAEGMPLRGVLESALRDYLDSRSGLGAKRVVASTWGVIHADPSMVQAIMEAEGVLDA